MRFLCRSTSYLFLSAALLTSGAFLGCESGGDPAKDSASEDSDEGEKKSKKKAKDEKKKKKSSKKKDDDSSAKDKDGGKEQFAASGLWKGTFKSPAVSGKITGLISENGDARFVSSFGVQMVGRFDVKKGTAKGELVAFDNGSKSADMTATADVVPKKSLKGTYKSGGESGSFDLTYQDEYERKAGLKDVSDSWGSGTFGMTVDDEGKLEGEDARGCAYDGRVRVIDDRFNAFSLKFDVDECPMAGKYEGLAMLTDLEGKSDLLVFGVSGKNYAHAGYLVRGGELGDVSKALQEAGLAQKKANAAASDARKKAAGALKALGAQ